MTASEFRALRVQAGLSYRRAAAAMGVDKSTIYRWEHGSPIPQMAQWWVRHHAEIAHEQKEAQQ